MAKNRDEWVSSEEFDAEVRAIAEEEGVEFLLSLPGVWEIVAEELNNDAIQNIRDRRENEKSDAENEKAAP